MVFDFSAIRVPRQKHYSDSTLMTWNKKELIEYIRMLEHNYDVSIQFNENQAQYIESFCPFFKADRKTENSSEKPNNCEHITEDGVTCAKYPACDGCLDNPLNKVKGSERLVKGSEQTEQTCSKMEQVDKDINVRSKEGE